MNTLESYFSEEHHINLDDISSIEELLKSATKAYTEYFNIDEEMAWPYEIYKNSDPKYPNTKNGISISTTSMILNSLLRLGNYFKNSDGNNLGNISKGSVFPVSIGGDENQLRKYMKLASGYLLEKISEDNEGNISLKSFSSKTFGTKDVFSLAWLAEVSQADWERLVCEDTRWGEVKKLIVEEAERKLERCKWFTLPEELFKGEESKSLVHAFPALRLVQIIRQIKGKGSGALSEYYEYFEKTLHEQLSFSQIPDSRFDPAELMFCLEGMLLCQKNVVDRTLFKRVLEVLTSVQHDNAYWRPVKPYLATAQGLALFPVSIEIANSLLRACSIFDEGKLRGTFSSKSIVLLRRYWQWLRARSVRFPSGGSGDGVDLVGWHSEHVNNPTVIHLWETSQVIEFLLAYRNALQLHVARKTLVLSRFVNKPLARTEWSKLVEYESVIELGPRLQIYKDIGDSFIAPHINNEPEKNYSMLLYGPPGTGKTFIAQNIAKGLGRPLIEITVSDFLESGGAQVEARAKNVFEVLMAQPSCVVLFDEIDHFLLDRDSKRYRDQDTLFQFMTPGMLTKINNLRQMKSVVFIIATNYEDRIDPAIKRIGRIDKRYLVLPPDLAKRKNILRALILDQTFDEEFTDKLLERFARAAVFLGINDIKDSVRSFKRGTIKTGGEFERILTERVRTTSLETYASRFSSENVPLNARETPLGEFLCLVALRLEKDSAMDEHETAVLKSAADVIHGNTDKNRDPIVSIQINKYSQDLGDDRLDGVAEALNTAVTQVESHG